MKGNLLFGVLSKLAFGVNLTLDVFRTVVLSPYGSSTGMIMRKMSELNQETYDEYYEEQLKRRYYKFVHNLKKDGLVTKDDVTHALLITDQGRKRLAKLRETLASVVLNRYVKTEKTASVNLVVFDIPEKWKNKRHWLRRVLETLGFRMLQKSVWLGNSALPESFIDDLEKLGILDCVQIMAITKSGTICQLI